MVKSFLEKKGSNKTCIKRMYRQRLATKMGIGNKTSIGKKYRHRSVAAKRGVFFGSALFA